MKEDHIYTWPNPHFPFLTLLNDPGGRIFLISNLTHNYDWLKGCSRAIKPTDYFFVSFGWVLSSYLADQAVEMFASLSLKKNQFFLMCNTPEELLIATDRGFKGAVINNNTWINYKNLPLLKKEKKYDACYIARPVTFKRHFLCENIPLLALAAGDSCSGSEKALLPKSVNNAHEFLDRKGIASLCAESHCGLIFSETEGACYASSEYLLCGIPVVSTASTGGRHMWYNSANSIICDDTKEAVAAAVEATKTKKWNPESIRETHILQAEGYKNKFCAHLQEALIQLGMPSLSAVDLFKKNDNLSHWEQEPRSSIHIQDLHELIQS